MQTKLPLKQLFLVLPVVTLMACSSSPSEEELAQERTRMEQQRAEEKAAEEARVEAEAARKMEKMQEMVRQERAELMENQTVYFDFDRSTLKSDAFPVLAKHAAFLVKNPEQEVVIEGHCDSRGTPEYNIALGERRAKAVESYLINSGVAASQISVVSYGEEKPAVTGTSDYAMAQNRRGIVVYQ